MSTKELYYFGGMLQRLKAQDHAKTTSEIKYIESTIPSTKTISISKYQEYVRCILMNLDILFHFYGYNTTEGK
jgi:hypothetical protein